MTPPRTPWPDPAQPIVPDRVAAVERPAEKAKDSAPAFSRGISAAALAAKQFDPVRYVIDRYLAEGLTLLAGKPKIGKSWLALNWAMAVASGRPAFGSIPVCQGDVIYLALEDNERRLKSRIAHLGVTAPERLTLVTEWPKLDDGCIEELRRWISSVERPVLIVVDVLQKIRPATRDGTPLYEADYKAISGLQTLAGEHGLAVLVVTHVRKMEASDPLDQVSGTLGLTGAADTILVLNRDIGTAKTTLYGRGRDIEEIETAVEFNRDIGTWRMLGAAHEVAKTNERQGILDTLRNSANPLTAREISDLLGKNYPTTRKTLTRMATAGEIEKTGRGLYTCPNGPNVSNAIQKDIGTLGTPYFGNTRATEDIGDPTTWGDG